jgi:hypothetical protein
MAERKPSRSRSSGAAKSVGEHQFSDEIGTAFVDGLTFRSKPVQYAVVDGMALVEGDINLGAVEDVVERSEVRRQEMTGGPVAAAVVIAGSQFRWPNCTIPYQIADDLPSEERVTEAISHWETNTSYRFVLRTPDNEAQFPDWVEFVPGGGCSSFVGRQGGRQTVTLGSGCTTGNTIHEIGHVVGLWHEQSREDRDAFVTIQWANIMPAAINNFAQHITDGDDVGAYDYGSIMHYPRNAFTANGQDTIIPADPGANIGQRTGLSAGDIAAANSLCAAPPLLTLPTRPTLPTALTFPTRPTAPTFPTAPTAPTFPPPPTALTFPTRPTLPTFPPPPTRPTIFTPPTRPTIFTPPTQPTIFTPPTRPTIFTPQTRPTVPGTFVPGTVVGPFGDPSQGYYYDPYGYDPYGYGATGYEGYEGYEQQYQDPYSYDPYGGYADPYAAYDPYGYGATGYEGYAQQYQDPYGPIGQEGYYDPYGYGA